MPDWVMILVKCVLWVICINEGWIVISVDVLRRGTYEWALWTTAVTIVIIAALEGWITP